MTTWLNKLKENLNTAQLKLDTYTLSSDNNVVVFEDDVEIGRGQKITFDYNGGELLVIPLGKVTKMQLERGSEESEWKLAWEDLPSGQKSARFISGNGTFTYTGSGSFDDYTAIVDLYSDGEVYVNDILATNGNNKIESHGSVKIKIQGDDVIVANPKIKDYYAKPLELQSMSTGTIFNPISKIRAFYEDDKAFESGNNDGSTLEVDSKIATQQSTNYIRSVLNGYQYIPVNASGVYIDPAVELGDTVTYGNQEALVANVKYTFDGSVIADIVTPLGSEENYDEPYNKLVQQQFAKKVSLGDSYQGVTIDRQKGLEMLLSPTGKEDEALGKAYFDLHRGMAFQYRDTPSETWKDWLYFDKDEKTFRISMYDDMIGDIELYETYFAYSPNADGVPMYEEWSEDRVYIGFASAKERPTEPSAYKWSKSQGKDGQSIDSVSSEFYLSTSKEEPKNGDWVNVMPTWQPGKYLWTRLKIDYINPVSTEHTTPEIDVSWEALEEVEYRLEEVEIKVEPGNIVSTVTGSNDYTNTISNINQRIDNIQLAVDSKNYFNTLVNGSGEEGDYSDWEFETTGGDVWRRNVFNETMLSSMTGVGSVSEITDYDIPNFHQPNGTKYYEVHGPGDVLFQTNNFNRNYKYILTGNFLQPFNGIYQIVESNGVEFLFNPQSSVMFDDELEILPSDIYLFLRFKGADYKEPQTSIFIRKGTLSIDEYELSGTETVIFEILDDETSLATKKLSFYANGTATNGKFRIVKGRQYSYSVKRTKGTQPFTVDFNEYNANQQFIKKQTVTFNSGGTVEQTTLNNFDEDTLYISLTYNITGVSGVNRLELTEAMMNIGEPQEWNSNRDSTEVFKWARSEFEIQALQIQQRVSVSDYTGNVISSLINQTATTIKLQAQKIEFEGLVTANKHFKILSNGDIEAINAQFVNASIDGLTAINADITGELKSTSPLGTLRVKGGQIQFSENENLGYDNVLWFKEGTTILSAQSIKGIPNYSNGELWLGVDVFSNWTTNGIRISKNTSPSGTTWNTNVGSTDSVYIEGGYSVGIHGDEFTDISSLGRVGITASNWANMQVGNASIYIANNTAQLSNANHVFEAGINGLFIKPKGIQYSGVWMKNDGHLLPNGTTDLGSGSYRYRNIYSQNQPNVSSDKRIKNAIQDIPQDLVSRLMEIKPKMYLQGTQWHFGYIAQDVERALYLWATKRYGSEAKHYVDKFAMLHKSESHLSLLYGELAVLKEQQMMNRIDRLEETQNETRKHRTNRSNKRAFAKKRNARIRKRSLAS